VDTDLVIAWIDALESGAYRQDRNFLHTKYGYCCLGVLCDVAIRRNLIDASWEWGNEGHRAWLVLRDDGRTTSDDVMLPDTIYRMVGMATAEGAQTRMAIPGENDDMVWVTDVPSVSGDEDHCRTLTYANDGKRWSFRDIAQALRRYYGIVTAE
jgi:hypothetical protein